MTNPMENETAFLKVAEFLEGDDLPFFRSLEEKLVRVARNLETWSWSHYFREPFHETEHTHTVVYTVYKHF